MSTQALHLLLLGGSVLLLPAARAADLSDLQSTIDGSPVSFRHAMSYTTGGQTRYVELSTHPLSCEGVTGGRVLAPDETNLSMVVARRLTPDGASSWQVANLSHDNLNLYNIGLVEVIETPDGRFRFSVDLSGDEALGSRRLQYALRGTIETHDCGVVYRSAASPAMQPELTVRVAGEEVSILGATLTGPREYLELRLSDVPHGCGDSLSGADVSLTIRLDGTPLAATGATLSGTRFPSPQRAGLGPMFRDTLEVSAISDSTLETAGPVSIVLDGSFSAGAYPVQIQGAVTAERCLE